MGARTKLNRLHLGGDMVLAGIASIVASSWLVFFVALALLVGLDVHTGQIRGAKKNKPDRDVQHQQERRRK